MQALMAQGIATALATYEATRSESSGPSRNFGGNLYGHAGPSQSHPRSCTLKDFLACKPLNFRGTEGVVGLIKWTEKVEAVFQHSNCSNDCRVRYATATLLGTALTWWNGQAKPMGLDIAYALDWESFKGLMVEEYCPRQEIQKLEHELWNHKMLGSDIAAYTARFNDLASLCPGMVTPEYKMTERYIYGLVPAVQFHVISSRPTTFDSAKRLACLITEESIRQGTMSPQTKNPTEDSKRKSHGHSKRDNKHHRSNPEPTAVYAAVTNPEPTAVYAAIANTPTNPPAPSKSYNGKAPLCTRCNYHHVGDCMFCESCNKRGHTSKFCKQNPDPTSTVGGTRVCFECNLPGHFRNQCPKLRNQGGPGRTFNIMTDGGSPTLRDYLG